MPTAQSRITELLEKSKEWCTQAEIAEALNIVSSRCSVDLKALLDAGTISAVKPPPGRNRGAQAIYNIAGVAAPEGSRPYAPRKTPGKAKKPPKLKGFKATARAAKKHAIKKAIASAKPANASPRWAYTSEGVLFGLDTGHVIEWAAARSLFDFLNTFVAVRA